MKHRIIAAALLTAFAGTAFAQEAAHPNGAQYIIVEEGEAPPAGYAPLVPSYEWENGRFVRNGEVYQSLHDGD
jgi:hypothetical protein